MNWGKEAYAAKLALACAVGGGAGHAAADSESSRVEGGAVAKDRVNTNNDGAE